MPNCESFTTNQLDSMGTMTIKFDQADYINFKPQVYTVIISGTATKSNKFAFATFTITLEDICDPPVSLTRSSLVTQSFNIADNSSPTYVHDPFTINPPACTIIYY